MIGALLNLSMLLVVIPEDSTMHSNERSYDQDYSHALHIGVPELIGGIAGIKYELLLNRRDGIFVDASFGTSSKNKGHILTAGYRRHNERRMEGGFWGIFLNYADYEAEYKEKTDHGTTVHPYAMRSFSMGPYIGKRWIFGRGLSVVTRVGYGYPFTDFSWLDEPPPEHPDLAKGIIIFFEGLDAELSMGFCF